jgi:hypothetical protein
MRSTIRAHVSDMAVIKQRVASGVVRELKGKNERRVAEVASATALAGASAGRLQVDCACHITSTSQNYNRYEKHTQRAQHEQ